MTLTVRNRQRLKRLDCWLLRRVATWALRETGPGGEPDSAAHEMGVLFVESARMARLNWRYLGHEGPTDVITFDYGKPSTLPQPGPLLGDLFICVQVAVEQGIAFGTDWREELVRYLIHGILHLRGHDDGRATANKRMKRVENHLLRAAVKRFDLSQVERLRKVVA